MGKNSELDKFYTKIAIAEECALLLAKYTKCTTWLEPSAGAGSFIDASKKLGINIVGYDIAPERADIKHLDFLKDILSVPNTFCIIGNPPFGVASSLAIKFFNRASSYKPLFIAFILPATFEKISVQNKLDRSYHLIYSKKLPKDSFELEGLSYNVPCVYQIWRYRHVLRKLVVPPTENKWLSYVTPNEATFIIKRVGGRAGMIFDITELDNPAPSSHYFCKEKKKGVKEVLKKLDFETIRNSTAGVRSISKREITMLLMDYYKETPDDDKLIKLF